MSPAAAKGDGVTAASGAGTAKVGAFFTDYAPRFDALYGNRHGLLSRLANRYFRRSMLLRYERTMAACRPIEGSSVLDVGCGPGHYSVALARAGAARVVGLDFAPSMIALAESHAREAGVSARCTFLRGDFMQLAAEEAFDHVVVMGVMDYVAQPGPFVAHVLAATRRSAVFSFPAAGGFLAWQRKLRYRFRCPLFLYAESEVRALFENRPGFATTVDRIARDYFVTATRTSG